MISSLHHRNYISLVCKAIYDCAEPHLGAFIEAVATYASVARLGATYSINNMAADRGEFLPFCSMVGLLLQLSILCTSCAYCASFYRQWHDLTGGDCI